MQSNFFDYNLPIGIFDSGVGGLTVFKSLIKELPNESFIYMGDTARIPYGIKSSDTVQRYSIQVCRMLISRGIKMLVIACNTISALAIPVLRSYFPSIPIIGVIESGAEAACQVTKNNIIAVIATEATVKSQGYRQAINSLNPMIKVFEKECGLFVSLVEEGLAEDYISTLVAEKYLNSLIHKNIKKPDCLILGCTHFPIMIGAIRKAVGNEITVIDSADAISKFISNYLKKNNFLNNSSHSFVRFLVTDRPDRFLQIGKEIMLVNMSDKDVEWIDL